MSKKTTKTFSIRIYCQSCKSLLYKYKKEGPGNLVKCYISGITKDNTEVSCMCPKCNQEFARPIEIAGRPANKIIQSAVYVKGNTGKK